MQTLYFFSFLLLLTISSFGILSATYLNKYFKTQKVFNNITYIFLIFLVLFTFLCHSLEGDFDLNALNLSTGTSITFLANNFNLSFALLMSFFILIFNLNFQNSFTFLNLSKKYILYNKPMAYLYLLYILLVFSHNMIITIFIYLLLLIVHFFLILNPDLKELRKNYLPSFSTSFFSFILLFTFSSVYFVYFKNIFFITTNNYASFSLNSYWILATAFFLFCLNLCGPIYFIFKERMYYEDFSLIFIIFIFPLLLNIFIFFKVLYFVFFNIFNNIGLYFHYFQYFITTLFFISLCLLIKYIKNSTINNNMRFISIFNISNIILFFFQILFISNTSDYFKILTNFILFFISILLSIINHSGMLFFLMKSQITEISLLWKKSKLEIFFFAFCIFSPIIANIITFLNLNFHNFNFFYLFDIIAISILIIIYIAYFIIILRKKSNTTNKEAVIVANNDKIKFFFPSILTLFLFLFAILGKNMIYKVLIQI